MPEKKCVSVCVCVSAEYFWSVVNPEESTNQAIIIPAFLKASSAQGQRFLCSLVYKCVCTSKSVCVFALTNLMFKDKPLKRQ